MSRAASGDGDPARKALRAARGPLVGAGLLAAWSLACDGGLLTHRAVAGPVAIVRALGASLADGTLPADVGASSARAVLGAALGVALGLPIGLVSGRARGPEGASLEPTLDFLRAVPPLLVLPLALLALGYGETARVAVIAWTAALATSLHVAAAARTESDRERALRAMGATRAQRLRWVVLPELVPCALTASRQALSLGLVVTVVTEMMMGADLGLGARAMASQVAYDTPGLYAVLLCAGALGWAASHALAALERRAAAWRP